MGNYLVVDKSYNKNTRKERMDYTIRSFFYLEQVNGLMSLVDRIFRTQVNDTSVDKLFLGGFQEQKQMNQLLSTKKFQGEIPNEKSSNHL